MKLLKELNQNNVLQLIDVSCFGFGVGFFCIVFALSPFNQLWLTVFDYVMASVTLITGAFLYWRALFYKRQLINLGQWRKLSFKELFDLHEWRKIK